MKAYPLLLPLALLAPLVQAADLSARLERTQLSQNETLELILETTDPAQFGKPDLGPLEQDFRVLGVRQNSLPPGERVTTRWNVTLQPKASGALTIPALTLDGARSQPLTVTVEASAAKRQAREPVYLEASVERTRLYVQAETILTIRLYHAVALYDDHVLTPPNPSEARVDLLGTPQVYERDVEGVRHGVIEWRYAIHPLQSGTLVLPPQTFSATLAGGPRRQLQGRPPIQLRTPALTLEVLPQARQLSATDALVAGAQPDPDAAMESRPGRGSRRQCPDPHPAGACRRPGAWPAAPTGAARDRGGEALCRTAAAVHADPGAWAGRATRRACRPDSHLHGGQGPAASEVVWWNTETDTLERATLPAQTLVVAEDPTLQPVATAAAKISGNDRGLWRWQLATAFFALTTLLGFGLWWRARRSRRSCRRCPISTAACSAKSCAAPVRATTPTRPATPWTPGHDSSRRPWRPWARASNPWPRPSMTSTARSTAKPVSAGRARRCGRRSMPCRR